MPYLLPKQIAEKFSITDRSVYNRINRNPSEIKVKKELWKTLVDEESFSKVYLKRFQNIGKSLSNGFSETSPELPWEDSENVSKLEEKHHWALQKMEQLEKQTSNFQKIANDRAISLREEKAEKRELRKKYDAIQKDLIERIETFSSEKERISKSAGKWARRCYFLLWICFVLLILLAFRLIPNLSQWLVF